jgi:hypothetical protein
MPFGRPLPAVIDCVPNNMSGALTSRFDTTSWTLVRAAAANPTTDSRQALAMLCQAYWPPVYGFVRRSGYDKEQSQDLTQGFFTQLLEKSFLVDADQQRGRFRSFLLTAVKHFLANEWDREHTLKRGGLGSDFHRSGGSRKVVCTCVGGGRNAGESVRTAVGAVASRTCTE